MSHVSGTSSTNPSDHPLAIAFLGDLNGGPGRAVLRTELPKLREAHQPDLVLANAENLRNGSGLSPDLYQAIRKEGIDGVSLGDHVYRDRRVIPLLENPDEPISRPANLSRHAPGKSLVRIEVPRGPGNPPLTAWLFSVLGRIGMGLPANDPFAAADDILEQIPKSPNGRPIVIVDAHMEATSEKMALALHLDGRVTAVLGTHTHVPTADARILPGGTAFQSDVGMCGPYDSIIGRDPNAVLKHMRTSVHTPYEMGTGGERLCGAVVEVQPSSGRAISIQPFVEPSFR
ncbi:MAG: YmdB family metallophosphoesterase [Phycisphaerales bacterium]|nr:YmdB family metallophosphoesterase [Phycisphaerales bacterium]